MKLLVFVLAISLLGQISFANGKCKSVVKGNKFSVPIDQVAALDPTSNFIAYLENLLSAGILDSSHISEFSKKLSADKILNPFSLVPSNDLNQAPHIKEIDKQISTIALDIDALSIWAQEKSNEMKLIAEERSEASSETKRVHPTIKMNPVAKGSFWHGSPDKIKQALYEISMGARDPIDFKGNPSFITLLQDFEVSEAPVTQLQWAEVMRTNPAEHSWNEQTFYYTDPDSGQIIEMQPNHPMENITLFSALVFLNRLSERDGLIPAYDLSELKKMDGLAEKGELILGMSRSQEDGGSLRINAPGEDIYKAEGYRLPTSAEWEFVAKAGGKSIDDFPFDQNVIPLEEFARYAENSDGRTHDVYDLLPLEIDGQKFSSLFGNVTEWVHGAWDTENLENPVGPFMGGGTRGSAYFQSAQGFLGANNIKSMSPSSKNAHTGFRVAKTPLVNTNATTTELTELLDKLYSVGAFDFDSLKSAFENLRANGAMMSPIRYTFIEQRKITADTERAEALMRSDEIVPSALFRWFHHKIRAEEERAYPTVSMEEVFRRAKDTKFEKGAATRVVFNEGYNRPGESSARLTKDIEVMSSPVSQALWLEVMSEEGYVSNPSTHQIGFETLAIPRKDMPGQPQSKYTLNDIEDGFEVNKPILVNPDVPVETITWWSALVFANKMSEREGLPPVYDLSHIDYFVGDASRGTLVPSSYKENDPNRHYLARKFRPRINAPNRDIYRAKGYRLPTDAEWEAHVLQNGLSVDNLFEWVHDRVSHSGGYRAKGYFFESIADLFVDRNQKVRQGKNPQGHSGGIYYIPRSNNKWEARPATPSRPSEHLHGSKTNPYQVRIEKSWKEKISAGNIGFRLVRTLSPKEAKQ